MSLDMSNVQSPPTDNTNPTGTDSGVIGGAAADSKASAAETLAAQAELVEINREYMVAMAWYSFALAVSSKIAGR